MLETPNRLCFQLGIMTTPSSEKSSKHRRKAQITDHCHDWSTVMLILQSWRAGRTHCHICQNKDKTAFFFLEQLAWHIGSKLSDLLRTVAVKNMVPKIIDSNFMSSLMYIWEIFPLWLRPGQIILFSLLLLHMYGFPNRQETCWLLPNPQSG